MIKQFAFLCVLSFLASCSSNSIEIDNPTDKAIVVTLGDRDPITVPKYDSRTTSISEDVISVDVDGNDLGEVTMSAGSKFLLNPSLAKYYIEEVTYGTDPMASLGNLGGSNLTKSTNPDDIQMTILEFDGKPYIGYARVDSNLLIKNIWDYGVKDLLPKQVQTTSQSAKKRKIYRETYFIEHAKRIYREAMKDS